MVAGSLVFGHLLDIMDGTLVLGVCLLVQGVMSLLVPWCSEVVVLGLINAVSAFFMTGVIVGLYCQH